MQVLISPLESKEFHELLERFGFVDHADSKIYKRFADNPKVVRHLSSNASWWVSSTIYSLFDEIICVRVSESGHIAIFDQSAITQRESLTLLDALAARKEALMERGIITMSRLLADPSHTNADSLFDRPNPHREEFVCFYNENQETVENFVDELNKELLGRLEEAALWVNDEFDKRLKVLAAFVMGERSADVYDDCY